jgi:rare lipoprotein A (peptidoglycan hydrolase)
MPYPSLWAGCTARLISIRILQLPSPLHAKVRFLVLSCAIAVLVPLPAGAFAPTRAHEGDTQSGMASWYGSEQGRYTASGERFNPHALTAAHRHLPFDTIIRVTNNLNGRSVELRINDRGPWIHGRLLDVTDAAADVLDMKRLGTVPVTIEILKLGPPSRHAHE